MFKNKSHTLDEVENITSIKLTAHPPLWKDIVTLLEQAGAKYFALFGGAPRDANYAAYHNTSKKIKDYDIRIWLPLDDNPDSLKEFLSKLSSCSGTNIQEVPSEGTGKIRYVLTYQQAELDISIRPFPKKFRTINPRPESVAIDRAIDSDIALSSIAIDPTGNAWAKKEYLNDLQNKTLTVYQNEDVARIDAYTKRMQSKFTDHSIVQNGSDNQQTYFKYF